MRHALAVEVASCSVAISQCNSRTRFIHTASQAQVADTGIKNKNWYLQSPNPQLHSLPANRLGQKERA